MDTSKVNPNASLDSVVPRLRELIDGHLVELIATDDADPPHDAGPHDGAPTLLHPEAVASRDADGAPTPTRWGLLEECRLDPDRPSSPGHERASVRRITRTDPDPVLLRSGPGASTDLSYHDHYVVDGPKASIILHCLVTPVDVVENQPRKQKR